MNFAGSIAAGALVLGLASVAHAEGLTLKVEGGLGFVNGKNVGIFSLGRVAPETATSPLD